MKIKLLLVAIIGTLAGYWVTNMFIQSMSFWQYMGIEFLITLLHALYNIAKEEAVNK
jgi:hypothetical protein